MSECFLDSKDFRDCTTHLLNLIQHDLLTRSFSSAEDKVASLRELIRAAGTLDGMLAEVATK